MDLRRPGMHLQIIDIKPAFFDCGHSAHFEPVYRQRIAPGAFGIEAYTGRSDLIAPGYERAGLVAQRRKPSLQAGLRAADMDGRIFNDDIATVGHVVKPDHAFIDQQRFGDEAGKTDQTGTGAHGEAIARDESGGIAPELNKYRAFLYPQNEEWDIATESFIPVYDSSREFTSPPQAIFGFGEGRVIDCIVTEVSITELLFNEKLAPLRADVAVTLVEYDPQSDLPL